MRLETNTVSEGEGEGEGEVEGETDTLLDLIGSPINGLVLQGGPSVNAVWLLS